MAYGLGTGVGIDPTIATAMDQAFAADHEAMGGVRESAVAGDKLVAELIRNAAAQNSDLNSKSASQTQTLITTSSANMLLNDAGNLNNQALAAAILAERSAGGQPQAPATNAGVNSGGPTPAPAPASAKAA